MMGKKQTWVVIALFSIAMAYMESAVVVYLRTLVNRIEPYQSNPLPMFGGLGEIEVLREAATMIMLLTVGWLGGRTWRSRLAYAGMAFGIWDIFYYIFLAPMCGWPRSLLDWDILFLIPLPWWGPVISPVLIAALMIIGGTFITQIDEPNAPFMPRVWSMVAAGIGAALALYIFMTDALRVANQGVHVIRATLPTSFNWNLFVVALALMAAPIVNMVWQLARRPLADMRPWRNS
jgi:hypothetical protein